MKRVLLLLALFAVMAFTATEKKKIKIWLIGDSTMSVKEKRTWPETGWGMPFVHFWDSTVTVDNRAKNGRSTRSFMTEGLWKSVIDELAEGDYVFIQFGHNDEVPSKKTATTPEEFKTNLVKYITETRDKKAIPVLLTSVARRSFDSTGKITDTHKEYSQIVKAVATEQKVIFFDINKMTIKLYEEAGVEYSKSFFLHLKSGEHPNYPEGKEDNTHFSELGAKWVAGIVLKNISDNIPDLAERIIK